MKAKLLILLAAVGIVAGIVSAHIYGAHKPALPPVFPPAEDPYTKGVYANGIIESYQCRTGKISTYFPKCRGL